MSVRGIICAGTMKLPTLYRRMEHLPPTAMALRNPTTFLSATLSIRNGIATFPYRTRNAPNAKLWIGSYIRSMDLLATIATNLIVPIPLQGSRGTIALAIMCWMLSAD